jgi:O-antigen ligase
MVSVPYRAFYFFICVLTIFHFKWGNKIKIIFVPILIFIFLYLFRSLFDSISLYGSVKMFLVDYWLFAFLVGFLPIFPLLFKINLATLERTKLILFILAIFVNILGFSYNYASFSQESVGGRFLANETLNQISYGQTGVVLIIMFLSFFFNKDFKWKIFMFPFLGLGLINVALAGSRGPMIELLLVVVFYALINFKKIGVKNIFFSVVFLISLGFYFSEYLIFFDTVFDRIQETKLNQGSESEERFFLFQDAFARFMENPLFGYRAIGVYPHNLILESFMALGIFGGLLMIIITLIAFRNCFVLIRIKHTNWIGLIFLMYVVSTFISGSIWNSFEFWSLLGLSFSLVQNKDIYLIQSAE